MATHKASCNCGQLSVTCEGPEPERISLCQCNNCQKRTGTVFSVQAQFPIEHVTIEGKATNWTFPGNSGEPRTCVDDGATFHFCPECGSDVYWEMAKAPGRYGVAVGAMTDPTFPPPIISGYEAYGHPWALTASELPMPGGHHD